MENKKAILVTGASTGIGYDIADYLGQRGNIVFAGARKPADLDRLSTLENVIPIRLDVQNPEEIQSALEVIRSHGNGLYGLVNNAGLGGLGLISTWTEQELFEIFNVNVFGPFRMSNAFLPLLVAARGRIVNIGSQGGMITNRYYGPYTMTKHALEAYTEALHMELSPYGVQVSIVQPGGIVSNIGENALAGMIARFQRAEAPFSEEAAQVLASFNQPEPEPDPEAPESATNRKPSSPRIVSEAVYDALFSPEAKRHYLVGTHWEGNRVLHALLEKLLDENDNPRHQYARDELIGMLDEHLARRKP
jgi:short-subunit dehydrogenase